MLHTDRVPGEISKFFGCLWLPKIEVDKVVPPGLTKDLASARVDRLLLRIGVYALLPHPAKTGSKIAAKPAATVIDSGPPGFLAGAGRGRTCKCSLQESLDG